MVFKMNFSSKNGLSPSNVTGFKTEIDIISIDNFFKYETIECITLLLLI